MLKTNEPLAHSPAFDHVEIAVAEGGHTPPVCLTLTAGSGLLCRVSLQAKIATMKIRTFTISWLVLFLLCLTVRHGYNSRWPDQLDISYAANLSVLVVGGLTASVSVFALLQRGLSGQTVAQNLTLVIALLGGLLLYQSNWGIALAIGMIGTAAVVTHHWSGPKEPKS
jgi:hypothetical protein